MAGMLMAVAVAYRSRLSDRNDFDVLVETKANIGDKDGQAFSAFVARVQKVFAVNLKIGANIALNNALTENAFTMIVCIQLGIPLTMIGKPGSSKSLAKTIIEDTLKGNHAPKFYQSFRSVEYFAYLCSPHSTPQAILDIYKSAQNSQQKHAYEEYAAVLVLDEGELYVVLCCVVLCCVVLFVLFFVVCVLCCVVLCMLCCVVYCMLCMLYVMYVMYVMYVCDVCM